jgi:hypothetical protein
MAASDNFAPVAMPGLEEIPPPMAAEVSSGMSSRFTLDRSSFEKFLAAAWVLQCLHDQLHNRELDRDEILDDPIKTEKAVQTENSGLPAAMKPGAQFSAGVTPSESAPDVLSGWPADDETFAEPVVAQPAVETGILDFDAAVKAELETIQLKQSIHSENVATVYASKPPVRVLEKLAISNDDDKQLARYWPAFNLRIASLRTLSNRVLDAFANLRPVFRVNLKLRALRATAIATPVLLLAIVAVLLLLETWRYQPFHGALAISRPSASTAEAVVGDTSTTPTTTLQRASENKGRTANRKLDRLRTSPPPGASHRQVTDPATLNVVQMLSRYEISGLRRRARYGDAPAAFALGMAYEVGKFVPRNCAEAARWVTTAAEAGNAAAQYNLGLRYRDGDGVRASRTASEKWLRKAAARRYSKANLALRMLASP